MSKLFKTSIRLDFEKKIASLEITISPLCSFFIGKTHLERLRHLGVNERVN